MIVWGGQTAAAPLNTGASYDPATDTWTPLSTAGAVPAARGYPTAVWTGSEMIVWGGWVSVFPGSYPTSGGRYNPGNNTWTATSTGAGLPAGRREHTAVWTGSEMIGWGGYNGSFLSSGARYSPSSNTWTPTSTGAGLAESRSTHSAVWTGSEMIVWGGTGNAGILATGA